MKRLKSLVPVIATAMILVGCFPHQFPVDYGEEQTDVTVTLRLDYSTEMPLYTTVDYPQSTVAGVTIGGRTTALYYKVRHVVKLYADHTDTRASVSRADNAVYSTTVYDSVTDDLSTSVSLKVAPGSYTAYVWTDYVPVDANLFPFYHVDDFSEVTLTTDMQDYQGSNDYRDTFRGETSFDVPTPDPLADSSVTARVEMARPMGKFAVIATDVEQFVSKQLSRGDDDPATVAESRAFDFTRYSVQLVYTGYLPSAFNVFTNKPIDSSLGLWYPSKISLLSDSEACLAFDYVMVNGSEASVTAAIRIVDANNSVVAQSSAFRVLLVRGKLTEVRGKFLTASSTSGLSIITDFDDDYNILIQ